jgi:hypothetical protein
MLTKDEYQLVCRLRQVENSGQNEFFRFLARRERKQRWVLELDLD